MASTICLSTDMNTIYVISSGNVSSFSLNGNGVIVEINNNDISVRTASQIPKGTESKFDTSTGRYTVMFDDTANALKVIGVADMNIWRGESFSLSGTSINIHSSENMITVVS